MNSVPKYATGDYVLVMKMKGEYLKVPIEGQIIRIHQTGSGIGYAIRFEGVEDGILDNVVDEEHLSFTS
jgi:hypothetical protein